MTKRTYLLVATSILIVTSVGAYAFYGVSAQATLSRERAYCAPNVPVQVMVHNRTFHRVAGVGLTIFAQRDGNGRNILSMPDHYVLTEIAPFSSKVLCFYDDAFAPSPKPRQNIFIDPPKMDIVIKDDSSLKDEMKKSKDRAITIKKMANDARERKAVLAVLTNPDATEEEKAGAQLDLRDIINRDLNESEAIQDVSGEVSKVGGDESDVHRDTAAQEYIKIDPAEMIRLSHDYEKKTKNVVIKVIEIDPVLR